MLPEGRLLINVFYDQKTKQLCYTENTGEKGYFCVLGHFFFFLFPQVGMESVTRVGCICYTNSILDACNLNTGFFLGFVYN